MAQQGRRARQPVTVKPAPQSADGPCISRRVLLQRAGALGLTVASSAWLESGQALAAHATHRHRTAQPRVAAADHLVVDYLPSQPTGWGGVTIGGHVLQHAGTIAHRDPASGRLNPPADTVH